MNVFAVIWNDAGAASVASALLGLGLALLSLEPFRWDRRFMSAYNIETALARLSREYYSKRPVKRLYALSAYFALGFSTRSRSRRLAYRAAKIVEADPPLCNEMMAVGTEWINTVGSFARLCHYEGLSLSTFLQTNHLGIIREGVIVSPIIAYMVERRVLAEEDLERAYWGISLVHQAVKYNRRSPVQRRSIYISVPNSPLPLGPVLHGGPRRFKAVYTLSDVLSNYRLRLYGYRRSKRFIEAAVRRSLTARNSVSYS